jgi:hypothetical protein
MSNLIGSGHSHAVKQAVFAGFNPCSILVPDKEVVGGFEALF